MDLTRKQVIEILEKADSTVYKEQKTKTAYALEYAINSLKTDEAYQLMYEGVKVYTEDEVVAILEELKKEIDNMPKYYPYTDHSRWYIDGDVFGLIQQKIKSLKEKQNERN